jgi:tetratricopeptide (TPR) repeat protein
MAYMSQGDNRALLESAIESEKIAREANERVQIAKALWAQGIARVRLGEAHVAQALAEESLAICTELDQQNEIARCLNLLGAITYFSGNFDQTQIHWENALKVFQERGNRQQGMVLLNNLGVIADARGDYETALNRYDSALAIAQEIGDKDQEIIFLSNRGGEKVALKNYEAAELDLRKAIQLAGFTGSSSLPASFNYRAEALLGLGRLDEAFYSARQALVLAEEDKTPEVIGVAWRTLGMISARQGDAVRFSDWETHQKAEHDAQNCFDKSVKILLEAEIDMERARTLREWARYEFKRGNRVEGEKMWQEAKEIFAKLGAQLEVERMGELPG